jgi:exopolyphosphatase / guanosine-5'-triphosphate,3'-diphosphate pyrophosphatase
VDSIDVLHRMKLGALDIGTNTALLLLGEVREPGILTILADRHAIPRLGEGVDKTRVISDAAYARLFSVLKGHVEVAKQHGISDIRAVATSAMRDAANSAEIVERVERDLGIQVDIIPGKREAELTYLGGTLGHNTNADTILLDIGGGSTEISDMRNGRVRGCSINIGAVRLTERFLTILPADPGKLVEARALIRESLDNTEIASGASRLIAVGTESTARHCRSRRCSRSARS